MTQDTLFIEPELAMMNHAALRCIATARVTERPGTLAEITAVALNLYADLDEAAQRKLLAEATLNVQESLLQQARAMESNAMSPEERTRHERDLADMERTYAANVRAVQQCFG